MAYNGIGMDEEELRRQQREAEERALRETEAEKERIAEETARTEKTVQAVQDAAAEEAQKAQEAANEKMGVAISQGPTNRPFTPEQSFLLQQRAAVRETDTSIVRVGELDKLPPELEPHREMLEERNRKGQIIPSAVNDWGTNRIDINVGSVKDDKQAAYFATTLATDKDKLRFFREYAGKTGQSYEKVVGDAEKLLGDKLFATPQTDAGKSRAQMAVLAENDIYDHNGDTLDLNRASANDVMAGIRNEPNDAARTKMAKAFVEMTKNPASPYYGVAVDEDWLKSFRNSSDLPKDTYKTVSGRWSGKWSAMDSSESKAKNLDAYMAEYDYIQNVYKDNAYARNVLTRDLKAEFKSQTDYDAPTEAQMDIARRAAQNEMDARRAAQEDEEDEESGLVKLWRTFTGIIDDIFPDKPEKAEAQPAAEAPETQDVAEAEGAQVPVTLVASASPTPIPAGDRAGSERTMTLPAQQTEETPTIDEQIAMRAQATKTQGEQAPMADSRVNLTQDMPTALEYWKGRRWDELDDATRAQLEDDWKNPGARILMGELTEPMRRMHEAGNEPSDRVRRLNMEQLGDTLNNYSMIASSEDFPPELYGNMMYAMREVTETVDELIRNGDREQLAWYDKYSDLPAYEQYIQEFPESVAPMEGVLTELNAMRAEKAEHDAQIKASADQLLVDARTATKNHVESAEQAELVAANAPQLTPAQRFSDPTFAKMSKAIDEEYFNAASYMGSTGGFFETWTYKTMEARGITSGDYEQEAEYFGVLKGEMHQTLCGDMDVAASLDMTLEQYYAAGGGSLDTLAMRSHEALVSLGGQITEADAKVLDKAYGPGIETGELIGGSMLAGYDTVTGKACQAVYTIGQIANPVAKAAKLESDYVSEFGPWIGVDMYERDMRALLETGEVPEALAKEIQTALDGGVGFALAIEPEAYGFVRSKGAGKMANAKAWHEYRETNATQTQNFIGDAIEGVTSNLLMAAGTWARTATLGAAGIPVKAAQMLGMMNGYGKAGFVDHLNLFSNQGYTVREGSIMAAGRVVADAAANVVTFNKLTNRITGIPALFDRGVTAGGGAATTKTIGPVLGMAKAIGGGLGDEILLDPAKEGGYGVLSDALIRPLIEANRAGELGLGTVLRSALSLPAAAPAAIAGAAKGVKESIAGEGEITAKSIAENLGMNIAVSLPLVILGAVGENGEGIRDSFQSVKAAKKLQAQPTAENANSFVNALVEDVTRSDEFVDGLNTAGANAQIAQQAAVNLVTNPDPVKSVKADAKHEQAAAHKVELEASQTRVEIAEAAYYERKAAGDVAGAIKMRSDKAKAQQGVNEHQREYDQNVADENRLRGEMIDQAKAQATASVKMQKDAAVQKVIADQQAQEQQAETQRQRGNVAAMDADAFIEENYADASDDEKQVIRDRFNAIVGQTAADPQMERVAVSEGIEALRTTVQFASRVQKKFGVPIKFAKSLDGAEGLYDGKSVIVAMDATQGEVIKRVLAHELTHAVEGTDEYKEMARILLSRKYGSDNAKLQADIQSKVRRYNAHYKKVGRTDTFTEKDALKEIIADYNGELLSGNEEAISRFVAEEPTMARRIYESIKAFVKKLVGVRDPAADEIRNVQKLFEQALSTQRDQRVQARSEKYSVREVQPIGSTADTEAAIGQMPDGTAVRYSLKSWTEDEKIAARAALTKAGHKATDVERWIDQTDSVAAVIAADKSRLDYEAADNQVMLKDNAEYVKTLDASTLCAKRLLYQGTFDAIQHALPDHVFTSEELLDLLNLMKDEGYETPCGVCYVESRRRHLGKYASEWLEGYDAKGGYQPKLDDVTTTDGLERMRHEHPEVYKSFTDEMNSKGSSNPKVVQLRTDYRGDIRKLTPKQIEKIVRIGGMRVQSFSDFETPHLIDMMQATLDMAGKELTSQAYTKVPNFAWVFGDTGIKINLSLMAEGRGVDDNGNLIFSSTEGMDIDEALKLRERYSENVGTIIVGANDEHIKAAMADPRIDYIIPFHRSGWGKNELQKVGVLQTYEDYQAHQNERRISGYTKAGEPKYSPVNGGNFYPIDYWDYSKSGDENAATYLRMCEEDDRVPKFEQFLSKDADGHWVAPSGYWKMLIDFKMYDNDGVGAPQRAVTPVFNMDEAMRVLDEYEGGANELPVAQDIVDRFVSEIGGKAESRVQYSLRSMPDDFRYVSVDTDQDIFEGHDPAEFPVIVRTYIKDRFRHTIIGDENNMAFVDAKTGHEYTHPAKHVSYEIFENKMRAGTELDNLVKAGVYVGNSGYQKRHPEFPGGFDLYDTVFEVSGKYFQGRLNIGIDDRNRRHLYDMTKIKSLDPEVWVKQHEAAAQGVHQSSNTIIHEAPENINGKYSLPNDDALDAEISAWRAANEAEMERAATLDGESQFAQTAQKSPDAPEWWKREMRENPLLKNYAKDTNDAQLQRAARRIALEGYNAEVKRLLEADAFDADDTVEAGAIMNIAFGQGDVKTALDMALKYRTDGTEHATAMQARKMFAGMTPSAIKIKVAGETEAALTDYVNSHQPRKRKVNRKAEKIDEVIRKLQGGDELRRQLDSGVIDVSAIDNRWGIPINEKQKKLIEIYKLGNVARPGVHYNRATTKQRMLEAILCTPDPDADSGNGLTLTQRLEWMNEGKAAVVTQADLNYIADQIAEYITLPESERGERAADLALARAYEAFGNITPASLHERMRTWRYTSMLLSLPSAERNVIGNSAQNLLNATADGVAVELDRLVSLVTKERTRAHLSLTERINGWYEFAKATRNTGRDFFTDKAITGHGEDRYNLNQRGRVFQTPLFETMRLIEGYLMSVGDRNFWKKKYVNSLAEQYRVAELNHVKMDYEAAADQAEAEANYATFNEDSAVRELFSQAKRIPIFGDVVDFVMPFTGVPTNITKRMWQFSPGGLAYTALKHGINAAQGKTFNQRAFVDGMARGLTGTALFVIGMALRENGMINLGTGEEEDERLRDLHIAQGAQYSPYIRVGDENVSLAVLAPSVSPIIMGATAHEIFKDDADALNALTNACLAGTDQIFDASYMSALQDIFSGYGSPSENILSTALNSAVSQNVPSVLSQMATAMDPYVRDTKDKNYIMQALKSGLIQKIPGMREKLEPKTEITGQPVASKAGWRNFLDPFTTTNVANDAALDELERLSQTTGSSSHIPEMLIAKTGKVQILAEIADSIGMDRSADEHKLVLSARQRSYYNQMYGQLCFEGGDGITGIRDLMSSAEYRYMSDNERTDAISKIRAAAKRVVQREICREFGWMK